MSLQEIKESINGLNHDFEAFKEKNDQYNENQSAETKVQIEKISASMDEAEEKITALQNEVARESNGGSSVHDEYRERFANWIRTGKDEEGINELARNELSISVDSEGGVTIPEELDREILKLAEDKSSMRPHATVKTVGGAEYKKLVQHGGVGSGWVGEKDQRPQTDTPTYTSLTDIRGEIYAMPAATQTMLDDAFFNVEGLLISEGAEEFIRQEERAFVNGDGTDKPKGILAVTMNYTDDDRRTFGTIQKIKTGVASGLPSNIYDFLMDLQDKVKEEYDASAIWMMNKKTKTKIRQVKDKDGHYIWSPGVEQGAPTGTLLGKPLATNTYFPAVGANALPILYGDLKAAYTIVDRIGTRILRDPYTKKPYVLFYMTKRVGSMIVNTEAVKIVEVKA